MDGVTIDPVPVLRWPLAMQVSIAIIFRPAISSTQFQAIKPSTVFRSKCRPFDPLAATDVNQPDRNVIRLLHAGEGVYHSPMFSMEAQGSERGRA